MEDCSVGKNVCIEGIVCDEKRENSDATGVWKDIVEMGRG